MKVLVVSGILESDGKEGYTQPFVDRQMESLINIGIEIIPYSIRGWQSKFNYLKSIFEINNILKNNKDISLIHAHYSYSGIVSSFQKKVPVIVSLMGDDIYGTSKRNGKISLLGKINMFLIRHFFNKWAAIIVKSKKMAAYIKHPNLYIIPNGVDLNIFAPIEKNEARKIINWHCNEKYVLFGGNPDNIRKNFNLSRESIGILSKEGYKINLVSLKNIPHSEIPVYLNASDCILFTSYSEGSPNIIKEAIACNLPVVSVNVGDVEERIKNLPNCYLCEYDSNDLSKHVKLVLQCKSRENIRESLNKLTLNEVAQTILNVYKDIFIIKQ